VRSLQARSNEAGSDIDAERQHRAVEKEGKHPCTAAARRIVPELMATSAVWQATPIT
jgi:hypothetical protein